MPRKSKDVPLATNLLRRGATYYFRARVPLDLIGAFGRKEVWLSLRTKEPREARRLLPAAQAKFIAECDDRRRAMVKPSTATGPSMTSLTDDDLRRFAQEYYLWELNRDEEDRRRNGKASNTTRQFLLEIGAPALSERAAAEGLGLGTPEGKVFVSHYAEVICEREGLPKTGPAYEKLVQALLRARMEAFARERERDTGDFGGRPRDELLIPTVDVSGEALGTTSTLAESLATLCQQYVSQRRDVSTEWHRAIVAALAEFQDYYGATRPLSRVTKRDVAGYKDALLKISAHACRGKTPQTFRELVKRGRQEGEKSLANGSINRRLSALAQFGAWAVDHGYVDQNAFSGLSMPKNPMKRRPFNTNQLQAVFASPLFVGCASSARGDEAVPGEELLFDWRFWCMPLALFTGARLGELLQLRVEDLNEVDGVPCVQINEWSEEGGETSGKKVKSEGSTRVVPVHSVIVSMGFIDHVARQRRCGQSRIFPGIKADNLGREATGPSKFFNRYLTRISVKRGGGLVFHSFRHTLIDALRRAGHTDATIAGVVGHGRGDDLRVTRGYGEETPVPMFGARKKAVIIESASFGNLDLSHLTPQARAGRHVHAQNVGSTSEAAVPRAVENHRG